MKKKAFTLIELIAVLVILAILALIVTPLVMNIIRKAKTAADKRSIDAYGRSIELAIASYLLDTGTFPTSMNQLTVEYKGDEVVCTTTQLNTDSSVYLAGCTVAGRSTGDYTYGSDKLPKVYNVGDEVTYNNINYYVIKNSSASEESVTLLKAEPLSYEEVQTYSNGTGAQTSNQNGYGAVQYHQSSSLYSTSYIKVTVDAWKEAKAPLAEEVRLISLDDLTDNLGYEFYIEGTSSNYIRTEETPIWVYNYNFNYWTMSATNESGLYIIKNNTSLSGVDIRYGLAMSSNPVVRPVIVLPKSAID